MPQVFFNFSFSLSLSHTFCFLLFLCTIVADLFSIFIFIPIRFFLCYWMRCLYHFHLSDADNIIRDEWTIFFSLGIVFLRCLFVLCILHLHYGINSGCYFFFLFHPLLPWHIKTHHNFPIQIIPVCQPNSKWFAHQRITFIMRFFSSILFIYFFLYGQSTFCRLRLQLPVRERLIYITMLWCSYALNYIFNSIHPKLEFHFQFLWSSFCAVACAKSARSNWATFI